MSNFNDRIERNTSTSVIVLKSEGITCNHEVLKMFQKYLGLIPGKQKS